MLVLTDALRGLSAAHREVVFETYFRGRTVQEAAESLGLPVGTVKSRVYYALRALRIALEEQGVTA
jgi:RNA polymerase sigma-70 factor (ECF subfamily)